MKVGDRFGMLVVIELFARNGVRVRCDCGNRRNMPGSQLLRGFRSCGCAWREAHIFYWPTDLGWARGTSEAA